MKCGVGAYFTVKPCYFIRNLLMVRGFFTFYLKSIRSFYDWSEELIDKQLSFDVNINICMYRIFEWCILSLWYLSYINKCKVSLFRTSCLWHAVFSSRDVNTILYCRKSG